MPTRVLRIIARLNIGGPARHVLLLERDLAPRGYVSRLLYGRPAAGEGEAEIGPALDARSVAALGREVAPLKDALAFWAILRELFRIRPHIVHTHTAKAGTLGRLAAWCYNRTRRRRHRAVVIHTFHGHVFREYFSDAGSQRVQRVERFLSQITDRIVVISETQRRDIVDVFRIAPADKVRVIPLGLDLAPLTDVGRAHGEPLRRNAGFGPDDLVCGFVGRLTAIKNLDLLFAACERAFAVVPTARLLVVGDGEERARLEVAVAASPVLRGRVAFVGWQTDLVTVYGAVDLVVLTSRNEGTPVALIEAMAAGRPVVSTNVGGVADVIKDGVTGLLAPNDDVASFATALQRLLTDADQRQALGAAGRADVLARFGYQRLIADIDALYHETLEAHHAEAKD